MLAPAVSAARPVTSLVDVTSESAKFPHGAAMLGKAPLSSDGRYVVFSARSRGLVPDDRAGYDLFVRDRRVGTTTLVTAPAPGTTVAARPRSYEAAISANGRYVVFDEYVSDLVPGDTNENGDIFMRDLELATTRRVAVAPPFSQGGAAHAPSI